LKAKIIQDPYFRFNDVEYRWISKVNWTFERTFEVEKVERMMTLVAEGIDTISTIKLNGKFVGKTENQFRKHEFNVKNQIKKGNNHLQVDFYNAVEYPTNQQKSHPYKVPHDYHPFSNGEFNRNFIRKSQCSYSWGILFWF
jgi:beta-mannosidase